MWRVVGVRLHALGDTLAMRERRPRCVRGDEAGAASQHGACIGDATTNVAGTRAHPRMTRQPLRRPVRTRPRTGVGPSGRKAPRQLSSFGGAVRNRKIVYDMCVQSAKSKSRADKTAQREARATQSLWQDAKDLDRALRRRARQVGSARGGEGERVHLSPARQRTAMLTCSTHTAWPGLRESVRVHCVKGAAMGSGSGSLEAWGSGALLVHRVRCMAWVLACAQLPQLHRLILRACRKDLAVFSDGQIADSGGVAVLEAHTRCQF